MKKEKEMLSSGEVCRILGISKKTLFNWTKKGKLHYIYLPNGHRRFFRVEIDRILGENKVKKEEKKTQY
jgi:excisionase family DNA binding protein